MGFSGLNSVMQGIFSSQEALRITSENIQNASTEGYARRVATFNSTTPSGNIAVSVKGVVMRDSYLDSKVWKEKSISTEWATKTNYYDKLMGIIDEPTEYSLSEVTNDFFSAFENLANEPSNVSYRIATVDAAKQFTDMLNNMGAQLESLQRELNEDVYTYVAEVNGIIEEIGELNGRIYETEIAGRDASHLKDTLQNKINELSQYGNVTVEELNKGKLSNGAEDIRKVISFGGFVVVNHTKTTQINCVKRDTKRSEEDIDGLYDVKLDTGSELDFTSGKLKALMEIRDGDGESDVSWVKGTVYYMRELNNFAVTFAKAFNEGFRTELDKDGNTIITEIGKGYADGYTFNSMDNPAVKKDLDGNDMEDADGNPIYAPAGLRFFTPNSISSAEFANGVTYNSTLEEKNALYEGLTAKNISISSDILNDVENMLCSFTNPEYENDVQAILDVINFRENSDLFAKGDIDRFIEGLASSVGLDASKAQSLNTLHDTLLKDSINSQAAYSDVSLDEEATFAVQFQYMYKACANLVNIYSELYDSLLNAI